MNCQCILRILTATLVLGTAPAFADKETPDYESRSSISISGGGGSSWSIFDTEITDNGNPTGGSCTSGGEGDGIAITEASIPAGGDAFDSAGLIFVNGTQLGGFFNSLTTVPVTRATFTSRMLAGLEVQSFISVLNSEATLRQYVRFTNPSTSDAVIALDYANNFSSNNMTTIEGTASGDAAFDPGDGWVVTSDGSNGDAVNTTVFGDTTTEVPLAGSGETVFDCNGTEGLLGSFLLAVPAGETRAMVFFHHLNDTATNAIADAAEFDIVPAGSPLMIGLTRTEMARVANFAAGTQEADLAVTKSGPTTAVAGTEATYTIAVTNNGPDNASNVSVDDSPPGGFTFNSATAPCTGGFPCDLGTVNNGETVTFDVTLDIDPGVLGDSDQTASVSSDTIDPDTGDNSATETTTVVDQADIALTKTGATTAVAGTQATYTIGVTNNGPSTARNVTVSDTPPAGFTLAAAGSPCSSGFPCTLGTMAPGATTTFDVTFDIAPGVLGDVAQSASVSTSATDNNGGNNADSQSTTIIDEADVAIAKTGPATAAAGTQATYTIEVTNNGPSDARDVTVSDTPPSGFTFSSASAPCSGGLPCNLGAVGSGDTVTFDVVFDIDPDVLGDVDQVASVTTSATDNEASNDTSSVQTSIVDEADLGIAKSGPATATAGTTVTFTVDVTNGGPSDARNVEVAEMPPAEYSFDAATAPCGGGFPCSIGTVDAGDTVSFDVTYAIDPSATGDLANSVSVSTSAADGAGGNDTDSATTGMDGQADLGITKTSDSEYVMTGEAIDYQLEVTNAGPSDAPNVVITDNLPYGHQLVSSSGCAEDPDGAPTCSLGTLAAGGSATVTLTATVAGAGGITNTASVASDASDPTPANNTGSVEVLIIEAVPALNRWGLALLAVALFGIVLFTMRRRARA
jgi:uncharacterized repeat protein (TIGR01451 family)